MSDKETFAANLKSLIDQSPLSRREVAQRAGIGYATLNRWIQAGLAKPDARTRKPLQKICRLYHVRLDDLWTAPRDGDAERYAAKVREMIGLWEELGIDYQGVAAWIDQWYTAAHVAERFRNEEPDLTEVVAKVKSLESDGEMQTYLEGMVRQWDLDAAASYRRLIETTERFLAAAVPHDPEQLGWWFQETHPRRWERMLRTGKLDNDVELIAFARHMMAEGLSPLEAYAGLVHLSDPPAPKHRRRKSTAV